ncbi:MAG: GNAT family protein [Bacteroidota bacterium]
MTKYNVALENNIALLRPLQKEDYNQFLAIALGQEIWEWTTNRIDNEAGLKKYLEDSIEERNRNFRFPFTIVDKRSNKIAGSTSYANISEKDKRLEIGWTWLGIEFQGTGLNKACKFLLLQNAFENLEMERVEFKTDVLNIQSRKAMIKIGAVEEGILRSHTLMPDGRRRDTIYFSILKPEWKIIKETIFNDN